MTKYRSEGLRLVYFHYYTHKLVVKGTRFRSQMHTLCIGHYCLMKINDALHE